LAKSWNYKLKNLNKSVVYAEIVGEHGETETTDVERIYYIVGGRGEFEYLNKKFAVDEGDVITIPVKTKYNYWSKDQTVLKIVLIMEIWDN